MISPSGWVGGVIVIKSANSVSRILPTHTRHDCYMVQTASRFYHMHLPLISFLSLSLSLPYGVFTLDELIQGGLCPGRKVLRRVIKTALLPQL